MTGHHAGEHTRLDRRSTLSYLLITCSLVAAACSGGDGDTTSSQPTTALPATSEASAPSSTSPAETTTTVPEPVVRAVGERWEETVLLDNAPGSRISDIVEVGGAIWAVGNRANGPLSFRSLDGGDSWESVSIAAPPSDGSLSMSSMVEGPGGRHLAFGSRASQCQPPVDAGDGYRIVGFCKRFRPVFYLSDDGVNWRTVEPPSMAPEGDTSVFIASVAVAPDGYVAAGTIRGSDWFGRLWTSPDGENWSVARDVRGEGHPLSIIHAAHDGQQLVVHADEHPCSRPSYDTPGWFLGALWANHPRILSGATVGDLRLLGPTDHPLAPLPMLVDCAVSRGEDIARLPHPTVRLDLVDGQIVMADTSFVQVGDADAEQLAADGVRTIVTLANGAWETTVIEQVPLRAPTIYTSDLVAIDGAVGLVEWDATDRTLFQLDTILADGDGTSMMQPTTQPVIATSLSTVASVGEALFAGGTRRHDPFGNFIPVAAPLTVAVWRSAEKVLTEDDVDCSPAPGTTCYFADFTTLPDYPDLAGLDLSGANLSYSNFGGADLSGADFTGAVLWGVKGGGFSEHVVLTGANFTGADLRGADIVDTAGADFTNADLRYATINFTAAPASLTGAVLTNVRLKAAGLEADRPEIELSLAGLDLADVRVDGHIIGPLLVITDLRGTNLAGVTFYAVDLSTALFDDLASLDLTTFDIWDNSICPDGLPPVDSGISTCAR